MFPFLNVGGSLPLCRNSLSAGNAQRRDGGSAMSTKTLRLGGEGGGGGGGRGGLTDTQTSSSFSSRHEKLV